MKLFKVNGWLLQRLNIPAWPKAGRQRTYLYKLKLHDSCRAGYITVSAIIYCLLHYKTVHVITIRLVDVPMMFLASVYSYFIIFNFIQCM